MKFVFFHSDVFQSILKERFITMKDDDPNNLHIDAIDTVERTMKTRIIENFHIPSN